MFDMSVIVWVVSLIVLTSVASGLYAVFGTWGRLKRPSGSRAARRLVKLLAFMSWAGAVVSALVVIAVYVVDRYTAAGLSFNWYLNSFGQLLMFAGFCLLISEALRPGPGPATMVRRWQ